MVMTFLRKIGSYFVYFKLCGKFHLPDFRLKSNMGALVERESSALFVHPAKVFEPRPGNHLLSGHVGSACPFSGSRHRLLQLFRISTSIVGQPCRCKFSSEAFI